MGQIREEEFKSLLSHELAIVQDYPLKFELSQGLVEGILSILLAVELDLSEDQSLQRSPMLNYCWGQSFIEFIGVNSLNMHLPTVNM